MRDVARDEYTPEQIQRMVSGIPFFNEIIRNDSGQFAQLMSCSRMLHAEPGDVVIHRGDSDPNLYFLLKGQIQVLSGEPGSKVINTIVSGQPLGTLAMIRGTPRSATLVADSNGRTVVLLALDHAVFRDLQDHSRFSLASKLSFYKMVVNDIRWTLEMNKKADPVNQLVAAMRKVPLYTGTRGTPEELLALHEQAVALADILCQWNNDAASKAC